MSILLSVIIPVYRAEATLDRCLGSILPQLPPNSQVILVEDGSPDASGALCDQWAEQDSRVQAFHQPNGGASAARNAGLIAAKGTYLQFVDADDELLPGIYEAVLPQLEAGAEICLFGCIDPLRKPPEFSLPSAQLTHWHGLGQEVIAGQLTETELFYPPYNKIFSADLWRKDTVWFDTALPVNEDVKFNLELFASCNRLSVLPTAYYYQHTENEHSLSRAFRTDLCDCTVRVLPALEGFLTAAGFSPEGRALLRDAYTRKNILAQYSFLASRTGALSARRKALAKLMASPESRRPIQEQLAADPNRLLALPIRFCFALRLSGLLALLFQLRIHHTRSNQYA